MEEYDRGGQEGSGVRGRVAESCQDGLVACGWEREDEGGGGEEGRELVGQEGNAWWRQGGEQRVGGEAHNGGAEEGGKEASVGGEGDGGGGAKGGAVVVDEVGKDVGAGLREAALWAVTHSYPHVADLIDHEISQGAISASGVNRCVVMDVRVVFMDYAG